MQRLTSSRGKAAAFAALALVLPFGLSTAATADTVDLDGISTPNSISGPAGGTAHFQVTLKYNDNAQSDPVPGCNATQAEPVTVTFSRDNPADTWLGIPDAITMKDCTTPVPVDVAIASDAPANANGKLDGTATGGRQDVIVDDDNGHKVSQPVDSGFASGFIVVHVKGADEGEGGGGGGGDGACDDVVVPAPVIGTTGGTEGNAYSDSEKWFKGPSAPAWSVGGSGDGVTYWYSTDSASGFSTAAPLVAEGANTVYAYAVDSDGCQSATSNRTIHVDTVSPAIAVTGAPSGDVAICDLLIRPSYLATDAGSGVDTDVTKTYDTWSTPTPFALGGQSLYNAYAADLAGNTSTASRTYTATTYGSALSSGFLSPLAKTDPTRFKMGSTVPVKFTALCTSGATIVPVANVIATLESVTPIKNATSTSAAVPGNQFRASSGGQYIFNLNTGATWGSLKFAAGDYTIVAKVSQGAAGTAMIYKNLFTLTK